MTKLIIQIPCLNEASTLPATLRDLPRSIPGIDAIETLVIDDGSEDDTARVARDEGVDHVVGFPRTRGLATAVTAGIDACLKLGADFIVNTDADNQYAGTDVAKLLAPLLSGKAEIAIGDRNLSSLRHLPKIRRALQWLGSWIVRQVSDTTVPDTTSGFRAYTREAALRITITSEFSYTLESIIQSGKKRMAIAHVPIATNPPTRESRLYGSVASYIKKSATTIIRVYAMYEPLKIFTYIGVIVFSDGFLISLRFLYFYLSGLGGGNIQSLILSAVLMIVGFQVLLIGLVADVISGNRKLIEDLLYRIRTMELEQHGAPPTGSSNVDAGTS